MGVIVGFGKMVQVYHDTGLSEDTEYNGGTSWGFLAGLGLAYSMNSRISTFVELTGNFQNWAPAHSIVTQYDKNGVDQLPYMSTEQKESIYVSQFNTTGSSPGSPAVFLREYLPLSSLGCTIGIHYSIGKVFGKDKPKYDVN